VVASMTETTDFTLPGGILDASGQCYRDGRLRPLTGSDEDWLYSLAPATRHAGLVTELLARCVICIGPCRITHALVRDLCIGDRDYLVLKLREATFGARLLHVLHCTHASCGAKLDLDLVIADFPVHARPSQPRHHLRRDGHDGALLHEIEFRVPRGRDQELVAAQPSSSPEALRDLLLASCVTRVTCGDGGGELPFAALPVTSKQALADAIEEAAPWVDLRLELECPECARPFEAWFDPVAILLGEVGLGRAAFEREIHLLALHYHWSLAEILQLTRPRRQRFLRLLADELGARAGAA
jgi:hypothetical protein